MIFAPVGLGVLVGSIVILLTVFLRKRTDSRTLKNAPGIVGTLAALYLFYRGFFEVRGFEGAAYGVISITLMIFALISITIANKRKGVAG
ncbi:YesK family protein [Bacillus sp. JJ864]|uniref:YesK family protein n=1 Tax=Bacillus sp. JJ864 TaxID=3122975 RepID=UPI002FFEDE82